MAELKHGRVTVQIPDDITIPPQAGMLSESEVRAIPKARLGLGQACADAATAWQSIPSFVVPGVTPEVLIEKGKVAETIDGLVNELEVTLNKLKQANLLLDAPAWELLRKVNDQVKAQGKHNPELQRIFKELSKFMNTRTEPSNTKTTNGTAPKGASPQSSTESSSSS